MFSYLCGRKKERKIGRTSVCCTYRRRNKDISVKKMMVRERNRGRVKSVWERGEGTREGRGEEDKMR